MSRFIPSKYQRLLFWDPEGRDSSCSAHRMEVSRARLSPSKLLEKYTTPKKRSWRQVVTCALTITMKLLTVKAQWNINRQSGSRVRAAYPSSRINSMKKTQVDDLRLESLDCLLVWWLFAAAELLKRGDRFICGAKERPRRTAAPTALPPARPRDEVTAIWMFLITRRHLPLFISSQVLRASCGSWISTKAETCRDCAIPAENGWWLESLQFLHIYISGLSENLGEHELM